MELIAEREAREAEKLHEAEKKMNEGDNNEKKFGSIDGQPYRFNYKLRN